MTQPSQAVGGDNAPVDANADANPFEALAADMLGENDEQDEQDEEEQPVEGELETEGDEPEVEADEEAELDELEDEPELPAIEPPNSLTAEEKELFKGLPREAQEFTARRIGELEKGFQSKAQEAAQIKQSAQLEALKAVEQVKAHAAEQLQAYAKQFEVQPPSAALFTQNPELYAQQLEAYQYYNAQRESAQRDADKARAEQAQLSEARAEHEAELFRQQLAAQLPELLDPATGQQLAKELNATAELLGFDPNEISDVSAIKALKATSEWKAKADKYDALMKRKMERVRAGKTPPPIAKPGTAREPDQTRRARAGQAWETAKSARTRNVRDEAIATWAEQSGWLD